MVSLLLLSITLAGLTLAPQAVATCQEGCLTIDNTVLGEDALANNTTGQSNTALGSQALNKNTTGGENTATGNQALSSNTTGAANTAHGNYALLSNTIGIRNTAIGDNALLFNTSGANNTAIGFEALDSNSTGVDNAAVGGTALLINTTGNGNTAIGNEALKNNTTGTNNIALGSAAGVNLTTGNSNIDIGNSGSAGETRTIRIGTKPTHRNTFIAGISGVTVPAGIPVIVDGNGHLGTTTSSARYKEGITPMNHASEAVLSLKPVCFRYKKGLDPNAIPQFGLVAEEVAKVDPDLVTLDEGGKPYTVRYEAVNAMLLNEFLKEHKKVEKQVSEIKDLKVALAQQAAQLQEVTARLAAHGL